jgi:preprotein translocase subunit SecE
MSNRAVRRQQSAGSKAKANSAQRAIPRTGPAPSAPAGKRKGIQRVLPRFLVEIFSELRKVIWPTRRDVTYLTFVVIVVAIIMGAVLGAIDFGFGWLIDQTLLE